MEFSQNIKKFKIILYGDLTVGKTCIFYQFKGGKSYNQQLLRTPGADCCTKRYKIDDEEIDLQLWDTAGQERFDTFDARFYRNIDCLMLVYDVSNPESFKALDRRFANVERKIDHLSDYYRVLVGNKSDLTRFDTSEQSREFAVKNGFDYFIETSFYNYNKVKQLFEHIAQAMVERNGYVMVKRPDRQIKSNDTIFSMGQMPINSIRLPDESVEKVKTNKKKKCC